MNRIILFIGFVLCLMSPEIWAQQAQTKVRLIAAVDQFESGNPFVVGVHLQMPVGWHTYGQNPGDSGIPTEVQWRLPEGFTAAPLEWPTPLRIESAGLVTFGYENEVVLFSTITPSKNFPHGARADISAEVSWLECKETCVPGRGVAELSLRSGNVAVPSSHSESLLLFEKFQTEISRNKIDPVEEQSLGFILLFAFIGGLILNLMPCVLPVLSLKILGFVAEAQNEGSKVWKQGVAFTAGVISSFWVLTGLLVSLRLGGEGLGWGFQLQSPSFVLGMTLFFLAMTLNLFGLFEFGSSLGSLQNQVTEKKGLGKSFASGILATVVATPCSAPFMGVAVGYALSQSIGLTFLVMSFLGFGVAAPYLLLSMKPSWIRKIPKPGEWMIGFKQFLGFLMLGTVLWLVWVYAQLQGIIGLGSILIAIGFISFGLWVWGRSRGFLFKGVSIVFIAVTIWVSLPKSEKIVVEKYSAARVEALHQSGTPLFIDFTAAWCLTCQVNKKLVLHREEIQAAFRSKGVVVMEADWTNSDPEITKALEKLGRASVPLYVLYGRDPKATPSILPEILTQKIVIEALEKID